MARRSSVKGAASFRRLLRALPDSANKRLIVFLNDAGPPMAAFMRSKIPVLASPRPNRTPGAARESISFKVTPKTLNLKVGEITKRDRVFYAHIINVGRKAQTVHVTRGTKQPYDMRVRRMPGLFVTDKTLAAFSLQKLPGYRTLMDSILQDASRGGRR